MKYTDKGKLYVRAYTASGALPVPGAVIKITGADENNRYITFSRLTDVNGVVLFDNLPAPTVGYSLAPSPSEIPYSVYDVEASKEGYYSKKINDVAIFSGEDAVLPINMIPISINGDGSMYPRDTLDTTVTENEFLE